MHASASHELVTRHSGFPVIVARCSSSPVQMDPKLSIDRRRQAVRPNRNQHGAAPQAYQPRGCEADSQRHRSGWLSQISAVRRTALAQLDLSVWRDSNFECLAVRHMPRNKQAENHHANGQKQSSCIERLGGECATKKRDGRRSGDRVADSAHSARLQRRSQDRPGNQHPGVRAFRYV